MPLTAEQKPQRLSDVMQMQNAENEPEVMRLGDVLSTEKETTSELNEEGFFQVTDTQRREWENLGPIGYFEQSVRQDKTEMIPFNPEGAVKSVMLLNAVNRVKRNKYNNDPTQKDKDVLLINNFLRKSEEERIRGYTVGGRVTQGVAALPGFMIEFLATGGVAAIGKKGIKKAVAGATRKIVKSKVLKFATRTAGGVAGAVARTAAMPHRVVENFADRQINASLELTEKGLEIAKQSREKPFVSFSKAFGDVVIENFSEVVGPTLGKVGTKIIPKRMANAMVKLWKRLHPNEAVNKIFTKLGYNGFIEELGEERVGALLRAVFNVEDFGAKDADRMWDRIMASIPNGEELLVESAVLAFPGATQAGTQQALQVIQNRRREAGETVEEPDLPENLTNKQIEEIAVTEAPKEGVIEVPEGEIEKIKPEVIPEDEETKKRLTRAEIKITQIAETMRQAVSITKEQVKQAQTELINFLESTNLEAKDKAKFIRAIKNVQTRAQLEKVLPEIIERVARLETAESVRSFTGKIKKELKKTKVKKQAGKPVGKFTAEVQEVLDLMRQTSLLSKSEAEAIIQQNIETTEGILPQEDIRLKNELLTLMSGLEEKTPESLQRILQTIQEMKKTGKVVRRLQRLERNTDIIKKKEIVIDQVTGGKGIKPGRETVGARKTTAEQFKSTMRSLGSKMILSWGGLMETLDFNAGVEKKILQDEFSTLDQDNRYKELTEDFNKDLNDALAESYGIDKGEGLKGKIALPYKIGAKINELQQEVNLGKFKNTDGKTVELIFSKDEMIKKWMELQDPTLRESFEKGNKFTPEMVEAIDKKLSDKDKAFAQKQFDIYKKQWQKVNPIYRELFGANLPFNEFYSPIARENFNLDISKGFGSFIHDATTRLAVTTGALKTRVKNVLPLKTQSSIEVLERHLKETNYFVAWAKRMKVFESVFKDANVRESINQEFTRSFLNSIDNTMNDLSTNGNKWARRLGPVEFFRKNFTLGKLMIKPLIMAKQLVSTLAYLEKIDPLAFTSGVADFWLTGPLENYKTLQKESILIRTRGANMERDIKNATTTNALKAFTKKQNFINLLMMNVKSGDKLAIIMGSWALRKKRLAEKIDLQDIVREYENFSAETQQSSDISRLSEVQRGGSFEKLFTMFKSSQRQYLQKELQAVKSLFQKGGTGPANIKKVAKVLAIYHVLLPMAFQYLANFGGWDDEDRRDYLRAGILGSFNGLFIFGDIIDSIIRKALGLRVFSNEVPISSIANDVVRAVGKIDWEEITSEDVAEAMAEFIEAGDSVGIPVTSIKNIFIGISDIIEGDIKAGIAEILGWSPRVAKEKQKTTQLKIGG